MNELRKSIRKLMVARLAVVTIMVLAAAFTIDWSVRVPFFILVGIAYLVGIIYTVLLRREKHLYILAYFQITVDTVLVSAVVSITQSINSPFTFLYILCIFAAGILLSFKGCLFITTLASGLYSAIIFLEFRRIFNPPPFTGLEGMDSLDIFFSVYVKVCAFYLVALLSAYLALNQRRRNKEMERDLRRADKLSTLGQLSTSIIHEIKNPLSAISSSAEYLKKEFNLDIYAQKLLQIIASETRHLDEYITRFLTYARVETGNFVNCNLNKILDETLSMLSGPISKRVKIIKVVPPDLFINVDSAQMKQVFMNLLLNGIQAMSDGGELRISARIVKVDNPNPRQNKIEEIVIEFTDSGLGISSDNIPKIFEPFYTTKEDGTGLGLAIIKRIVEGHKGRIEVRSELGKGSSFTIFLPQEKRS